MNYKSKPLKMKSLKVIVLLAMLVLTNLTVYSQTTSRDSLCFSKEQAVKILQDIKRGEFCDSIRSIQSLEIVNFRTIVVNNKESIGLLTESNKSLSSDLDKTRLKLKLSTKLTTFGIPSALVAGFLVGILLR